MCGRPRLFVTGAFFVLIISAVVVLDSGPGSMSKIFRDRVELGKGSRSCLILGATGATGSKVLETVLEREEWGRVVVVGRRPPPQDFRDTKEAEFIPMSDGEPLDAERLEGIDTFFNCIGTTRADAGSAKRFHDVEVGVTEKVAAAAAAAGIKHGSVVSAQGADPDRVLAPSWFRKCHMYSVALSTLPIY